jgi:hypothetical protein
MAPIQLLTRGCSTCHDTDYILKRTVPIAVVVALIVGAALFWLFSKPCRNRREKRRRERRQAKETAASERRRQRHEKWRAIRQAEGAEEERDGGSIEVSYHDLVGVTSPNQHISTGGTMPEKPPPTYQAATGQASPKTIRDPNPNSLLNV